MKYQITLVFLIIYSALCGQTMHKIYLDLQIEGNPVHPNGPGGSWAGTHVECRDSVNANNIGFYDLPVNSQGRFQDSLWALGQSGLFTIRVWRCDGSYLEFDHPYSFASSTPSVSNIAQVVNDTCLISHMGRQRWLNVTGTLQGNPLGTGAWAYTPVPLVQVLPSWSAGLFNLAGTWNAETNAYGDFHTRLPLMSRSGTIRAQVLDCNLNWIDYHVPFDFTQSDTVFFNLSTSCIGWGRTPPGIARIHVSTYVLDASQSYAPIANVPVEVVWGSTSHIFYTDASGHLSDSIPVSSPVGTINMSTTDCNGNAINSQSFSFDVQAGNVHFTDSLVVSCSPINNSACQASFSLDTTNSLNGELRLWNSSSFPASGTVEWMWEFGDGYYSNQAYPVHQYTQAGSYQLCLDLHFNNNNGIVCSSRYCDSIGMDANGNLILKGLQTGFTLVVSRPSTIGLADDLAQEMSIAPNPSTSAFRIIGIETNTRIRIIDILGRVYRDEQVKPYDFVSTNDLRPGLYIVQIELDSVLKNMRLLVE